MVAFSALTAHKPPVRNRELVTGQIIARNAPSGFRRRVIFPPNEFPAPHRDAALTRRVACDHPLLQRPRMPHRRSRRAKHGADGSAELAGGLVRWKRQIYELAALDQIQMCEANLAKVSIFHRTLEYPTQRAKRTRSWQESASTHPVSSTIGNLAPKVRIRSLGTNRLCGI